MYPYMVMDDQTRCMSNTSSDCDFLDGFVCPIGRSVMRDPVITVDGISYERANIEVRH
jgi:hypothetical protein